MKKRWSFVVLSIIVVVSSSAVAMDDMVRVWGFELSLSPRDMASESNVRDFSGSDKISQARSQYFIMRDSVVMELLPVLRSDYLISSDTVLLTTMEGSTWKFNVDSLSMNHPVGRVRGLASSNLSRKFDLEGLYRRKMAQNQTVILEPGDTVRNAKYIEQIIDCASVEPSIAESQTERANITRRYWFAENSIYNELNLPSRVEFASGGRIDYLYSATGTKLRETAYDSNGGEIVKREYVGAFEFENDTLERITLAEGYITACDSTYHAYIPDYQGNIVGVYNTRTNTLEQLTDYYPYGLPHASISAEAAGAEVSRRKFGGKELMSDHDYNSYDFAARYLNASYPIFSTRDLLQEIYCSSSPYLFCGGDPINFIDPTGMVITDSSKDEWDNMKKDIENQINNLTATLDLKKASLRNMNISQEETIAMLGSLPERIRGLKRSLGYMTELEASTQMYALNPTVTGIEGGMTFDGTTITLNYNSTAQFVHELAHGFQFETGEIAFRLNENGEICPIFTDIYDEINAYIAQFCYSPNSIPGTPRTTSDINIHFIKSLLDEFNRPLYSSSSNAYTPLQRVTIYNTISSVIDIYKLSGNIVNESSLAQPVYMLQGIYSKKQNSFK